MLLWSILGQNRYSCRAPKGGLRGALITPGRLLPPKTFLLDKLPWFAMVLVTVGGCFAFRNASCVYRLAGGELLFWSILE